MSPGGFATKYPSQAEAVDPRLRPRGHWDRHGITLTGSYLEQQDESHRLSQLTKLNSVALVRTRTIPTERPPPVGEVSANLCG